MFRYLCVLVVMLTGLSSVGAVTLESTRAIYVQGKGLSLKASNDSESPALIQSWVSSSKNDKLNEDESNVVPFIVTPLVAKIPPNSFQQLRINYTGESLPSDRESVFYLNMLHVPAVPVGASAESAQVQIAQNTRIKLFYRPLDLDAKNIDSEWEKLEWRWEWVNDSLRIRVANGSPYNFSMTKAKVNVGGQDYVFPLDMVAPFSESQFPVKGISSPPDGEVALTFIYINDYGIGVEKNTVVTSKK